MQKIKFILAVMFAGLMTIVGPKTVSAASFASIQTLPGYINNNNFKLSCTSDGSTAQFYYNKHSAGWVAFGGSIDLTSNQCVVDVNSSQVNDQTDYLFKVNVDGMDSSSTSTFYDASGPSPVSGYYKERTSDGSYKLHWTNPGDSDFDKVVIYRGDTVDFSADAGHEIARVSGGSNSAMTYDDNFTPDANKTYFYAIRALDHAGNSSSLVGDGSTSVITITPSPVPGGGKVTILPKEGGSVLGTSTKSKVSPSPSVSPSASPEAQAQASFNLLTWISGHKKISLGILIVLVIAWYFLSKRKK